MITNQKNRIKKIQDKVSPSKYKAIEDIITELDLKKNINSLTEEERRYLDELRNIPVDPDLVRRINQLDAALIENQRTKNDQK